MKKSAALLLAIGLVHSQTVYAADKAPAVPATAPAPSDAQKARNDDFVTLNFTNIDINALVKVMSELTRRNFILDERVSGKITLMTPTKITPDEAYQVFLSALEIKGFTAIEDGRIIRIIPIATARQSGLKVVQDGDSRGEGFVTKLIRMTYVNPLEAVRTLSPLVTKDGTLIAYSATNSVILTDSVPNIKKIESLIRIMDIPAPEGKGKINVYNLKHANADDVAKLLTALVAKLPVPPAPGSATPASASAVLEGVVSVSADKTTNALIIVASPADYEIMKDVLVKLDIRRRQVYVEAAIIEMGLGKQRELGFEFRAVNPIDGGGVAAVGGTNFGGIGPATIQGPAAFASFNGLAVGAVKGTFTFKGTEYLNLGALLRAFQTDGDVNVLSTPNILTTDNQKAKIMVGENVPFISGTTQSAASGGNIQTNIERKDIGLTMDLLPQISSDDSVRLDLNLEISNVIATAGLNPNQVGPSTSKRSASTTVVVRDRETMVIGGLIRDNVTSTTMKVPFLGDIPLLGWLFKYKNSNVEKTNLMIFITPHIIKNAEEAAELTKQKGVILDNFRSENRIDKKTQENLSTGSTGTARARAAEGAAAVKDDKKPVVKPAADAVQVPAAVPADPKSISETKTTVPAPAAVVSPAPAEPAAAPVAEKTSDLAPSETTPEKPAVPAEGAR